MLLQRMRDGSQGVLARIIVGAIIVVFALFGFGSITSFLVTEPAVATVDDVDVTEQEMLVAIERNKRMLLASGNVRQQDIDEDALRTRVLDELIERALLTKAADDLDLHYAEARLDQDIINTPAFQIDGRFDRNQFQLVIGGAGYTAVNYKDILREKRRYGQIDHGFRSTAFLTKSEIDRTTSLSRQTRDIAYLTVEVEQLEEKVSVPDSAVRDHYEANRQTFMSEETVDIAYVELKKEDLVDEVEVLEEELVSFFEEEKGSYSRGEERRVAHILIETNDEVSEEEAKAKIDAIHLEIQQGADFAELAREFSEDPGSAAAGGDLGFNFRGTYVDAFEEAAFALSINQVTHPILTEFGYHVIKLLDVNEAREPVLDDIREELLEDFRLVKAEEIFVEHSSKLSELAYENPDLFAPAGELALEIEEQAGITRTSTSGLARYPGVVGAAFSDDVLVDGNNSDVLELDEDYHVVLRVTSHRPSEAKPFEVVREEVRNVLVTDAAKELARGEMEEMLSLLRTGSITRYVADQFGLEWQVEEGVSRSQTGIDQAILKEAFSLPNPGDGGKSIGSVVLANGDAVVVTVTKVVSGTSGAITPEERDALGRILANQIGQLEYSAYREYLEAKTDIERL